MGVLKSATTKANDAPSLPAMFAGAWGKYRSLKFIQRDDGESLVLCPRDVLKWQDLVAYTTVTGDTISLLESELIMGIDAIFEGREDG